ncbi:MAG: S16 family serine protease, partial [Succinivibrio sp.]
AGGEGDIIDIERKAELAGQIHAKAMMIINGFISDEFGSQQPMPVSASLVFEQSYSEIDGDSASLTGLCAVISALSELPVRQDLAVTGAVDQFGDVQPVGGVNEKIEGFYRICRLNGLTGTQGVIIPYSCINQLVLRPSVINAVKNGKFHIYVVSHVTGAARLLMNTRWGEEDDDKSICGLVCSRLDELSAVKSVKPWWHLW